jgi:hypothetical protein
MSDPCQGFMTPDPCGIVETIQNNMISATAAASSTFSSTPTPITDTDAVTITNDEEQEENEDDNNCNNNEKGENNVKTDDNENDDDMTNGKKEEEEEERKNKDEDQSSEEEKDKEDEDEDEKDDSSNNEEEESEKEKELILSSSKMAAVSDLSDLSRKICIVTTAGLPWRTGTAVNPLARALYLTRGRPKHNITLMIPWLENIDEQVKVYGSSNVFNSPEEQKIWIQTYSRERILNNVNNDENENKDDDDDDNDEVDNLQISFYPAKYHNSFGSIFATVDICTLIPKNEADIAILEEPEHLTWFRSLPIRTKSISSSSSDGSKNKNSGSSSGSSVGDGGDSNEAETETETTTLATKIMDSNDSSCASLLKITYGDEDDDNNEKETETETKTLAMTIMDGNDSSCASLLKTAYDDDVDDNNEKEIEKELEKQAIIGWTAKFSYVVGILHTNYSAYMKQYGLGTSIVTASALQALSSVCVKAYTHRLIRLSDTLPELDAHKEVTCNVHGVRSEFFVNDDDSGSEVAAIVTDDDEKQKQDSVMTSSSSNDQDQDSDHRNVSAEVADDDIDGDDLFVLEQPIYFIGKVIWAKGFDKLLEIEDLYRKENGEYFPITIYGSGPDFDAISRAFLGRGGLARVLSSDSVKNVGTYSGNQSPKSERSKSPVPPTDQTANLLFSREGNLRRQIEDGETIPTDSLVVEVQTLETPVDSDTGTPSSARRLPIRGVIKHLKETTIETKTGVTKAISALSERITKLGLHSLYSEHELEETTDDATAGTGTSEEREGIKFRFDPPKSRYELRRVPVPARFLGVKDHALLRDIPQHKIFINLSITEVLCTTTAEALAMGKFVIIPNHRTWHNIISCYFFLCTHDSVFNHCV